MTRIDDDQKPRLDDIITQATDTYRKQFAEEDEGGNANTGHESGPDIPGREEPERIRPEKSKSSSRRDEHVR